MATIAPNEIDDFDENPEPVRKLLGDALELTKRNLDYSYGSADPSNGGMDCSGFIYYVLRENGVNDVPRDASEQYVWVRKAGNFRAVLSRELDSFELDELKPGDLLFWIGTYSRGARSAGYPHHDLSREGKEDRQVDHGRARATGGPMKANSSSG